jgi:transposase
MHIDASTYIRNGKTYRRVLLRNSYRVNGKVCHDTIANLSSCSDDEVKALKLALKHKKNLSQLSNAPESIRTKQGFGVGAVWALQQLAKQSGLSQILGRSHEGQLALWLVMACIIEQGSRLSAVRLAQRHHACDILGMDGFNENDLYAAMDVLAKRQQEIEQKLFHARYQGITPQFFLYDVTSSYFEGQQNELARYGYNRDKKKGKKQIVIGLLTDDEGKPIAIEVFEGNTSDPQTVSAQIQKLAERFGVKDVTLIGDRGMIKSAQIEALQQKEFHYITAITKPQIEKLVKDGVFQHSLFSEKLVEITENNVRYVLRRNPQRAEEIRLSKEAKFDSVKALIEVKNVYLAEHAKAKIDTAEKHVNAKAKKLGISEWVQITTNERTLAITINEQEKTQASLYDGCYVIKSDLSVEKIVAGKIHDRYKDLASVEHAFRTMKTALLEMRAIYVRKSERTRAHVFIVMLAYLLVQPLQEKWKDLEITVEEGIAELASICSLEVEISGQQSYQTIPEPRELGKKLLEKLGITLPDAIPNRHANVVTKKKLVSKRK